MPTYEYLCDSCGHNYELVQKMSEDSLKTCPECNKETLRRVINATAFHLKGSGWYKTDYAPSGSGTSSTKENGSGSSSGGGDAATSVTPTSAEPKPSSEASKTATSTASTSGSTEGTK